MQDPNAVTLSVDGLDYRGWKNVRIAAGIERQARDFSLDVSWQWHASGEAIPIRQGAVCEVRIGADLVLTGHVYATPVDYDARQITRGVSGRSLTADLVDCAAINEPGQWRGQSVQRIVQALASPYRVKVRSEVGETSALTDHTIEPGETAFASIDRLLTLSRLLSTDDPAGGLVIVRPGSAGRAVDRLEVGENVLSCRAPLDFSGVFSEYRCVGQRAGDDEAFGVDAAEVSATATDPRAARRRVMLIQQSGQLTPELAAARVNWERGSRIGKALQLTYRVQGWRQSNGALWVPNLVVRVVDPILGLDRDLLISEVEYNLGRDGTIATLTVAPAEAFEPEPADPHKARKLKKGGKSDNFEYLLPADWEKDQ